MASGTLYLISTPIGNLGDLSHRACETLKSVDWIACEDTRHSKVLLDHYGIQKPLVSYFNFSEKKKAPELISRLVQGGAGALISDAGTPGIADPGYRLIQEALRQHVKLEALPGASAFLTALVLSGLPVNRFVFEGFAPLKEGAKKKWLESLKSETRTVIFYESPHRLLKTLGTMKEVLGDVPVVVARELTKKFEEVSRAALGEQLVHFSQKKVLGEFVILWNNASGQERE
jgi:16S rRNA (cytidine1402-2'-O)-methyltransferase